jgi:hypothetical protein
MVKVSLLRAQQPDNQVRIYLRLIEETAFCRRIWLITDRLGSDTG